VIFQSLGEIVEGRKKYEKMAGGATLNDEMLLDTTLPKWSVKTIEIEWALTV